MSLIHWWPLNGDTRDYGLNCIDGSLIGSTSYDNSGKIGKCLLADTGNLYSGRGVDIPNNLVDELSGKDYSFAVWVKPNGNHVHYEGAIISSGNWNNKCWAFGLNSANTAINPAGNWYNTAYISYSFTVGTWYHIVSVQKSGTNYVYVNGVLVGSVAHNPISQTDASNTCIGRETYAGGYFGFNGCINDMRIYDHALTPKEIKEISKALVLHYDFEDEQIEATTNLLSDISLSAGGLTINTSSTYTNKILRVTTTSRIGSYTFDTFRISIPLAILKNGTQYSLSFKFRNISGTADLNVAACDWCDSSLGNNYTIDNMGEYKYVKIILPVVNYDSTYHFFDVYLNNGTNSVIEFSEIQLEAKDHATPYVSELSYNLFNGRTDFSNISHWTKSQINSTAPTINSDGDMVLYGYATDGNHQSYTVSSQGGYIPLLPLTTYTLSVYVKYSSTSAYFNMYFYERNDSSTVRTNQWRMGCTADEVGKWVLRTQTITTQSTTTKMYTELNCYNCPSTETIIMKNNTVQLVAASHANGVRNGGVLYDCSGYAYNGIPNNNNLQIVSDTLLGKHACKFSSDSYFEIPELPSFTDATYILWIKAVETSYQSIFIPKNSPTGSGLWISMNTESNLAWAYQGGNSPNYTRGGNEYYTNVWYCLAYRFSGSKGQWYINGVANGTEVSYTTRNYITGAVHTLGDSYTGTSWSGTPFNGYIADFKIYATALSAADIRKEYQSMSDLDKSYNLSTREIVEDCIDYSFMANKGIKDKSFGGHFNAVTKDNYYANYPQPNNNGLGTYTQSNLSVTMTDNGVRIYSAPNLTTSDNGNTMWGGLCWSPMKTYKDCLKDGHRYRLEYHVKGQSSRAFDGGKPYFTNMVGWGQSPDAAPTTNSHRSIPAGFNGEMDCYWDFTINDTVFKTTGSSVHSGFTANTTYLAYSSVKLGFTYASTGPLGTDIYITNLRLYDITSNKIYRLDVNGVFNALEIDETKQYTGFTQLKYIQSDGNQWIDSNVAIAANTNVECDIEWTDISGSYPMLYGAWSLYSLSSMPSGKLCIASGGTSTNNPWANGPTISANTRYKIAHQPNKLTLNDVAYSIPSASASNTVSSRHILLFAASNTGDTPYNWSTYCKAKIYSFKIYNGTTLARNFIPAKRNSDSTIGLLDIVTGAFYTNSGSGAFTAGPEVNSIFKTYDSGKLKANSFNER